MSACELCWEAASAAALALGGDVHDHYLRIVAQVDQDESLRDRHIAEMAQRAAGLTVEVPE